MDASHHAVITVGNRGIGRAISFALARMRCAVTVNYVRNTDAAEEVVAVIRAGGGTAHAVQGDVSNPDDVAGLVKPSV